MTAIVEVIRAILYQSLKHFFSLNQGAPPKIYTIQRKKIKDDIGQIPVLWTFQIALQRLKICLARCVRNRNLSIQNHRPSGSKLREGCGDSMELFNQIIAVSGYQSDVVPLDKGNNSITIIFQLIKPVLSLGYRMSQFGKLNLYLAEGVSCNLLLFSAFDFRHGAPAPDTGIKF
ncbi:hypothetical protein D3C78_818850 [compost metagenome]